MLGDGGSNSLGGSDDDCDFAASLFELVDIMNFLFRAEDWFRSRLAVFLFRSLTDWSVQTSRWKTLNLVFPGVDSSQFRPVPVSHDPLARYEAEPRAGADALGCEEWLKIRD
jgi:hypothetical protein